MPPSSGWREDSTRTVRPSGTNKARKAITHSARALGPAAAAAAIQRVLTTAATRNRTTSRKPRTRRKPGAAGTSDAAPAGPPAPRRSRTARRPGARCSPHCGGESYGNIIVGGGHPRGHNQEEVDAFPPFRQVARVLGDGDRGSSLPGSSQLRLLAAAGTGGFSS